MRIRAQIGMVLNLDKCIGCHTCSVTCKNVWTSRDGVEYAWFNNVETKPGIGYPKEWENQEKWKGGWKRTAAGKLEPRQGGKLRILANLFANPNLPQIDDYYEPFTFDYEHLKNAPLSQTPPTARPVSVLTGKKMDKIVWGPNWEDDLGGEFAAQVVFPVRAPDDLVHLLAGQHRHRARGGRRLRQGCVLQVFVVEGEGFVVVVDLRQVGVGEQVRQDAQLAALARFQLAGRGALPAALPLFLVFPFLGIADAGFRFDVVEPGVFDAVAAGPDVLAGDRASVAADALVQVQHHADLGAYPHDCFSSSCVAAAGSSTSGPSIQSTFFILRSTTNSSRLAPTVP